MKGLATRQEVKVASWVDEFKARKTSGMSVKKWCIHRGYSESNYYYHLRIIQLTTKKPEEPRFALLPALPTSEGNEETKFGDKVIVRYGEYSVEIPDGFSRQTILAIMEGLKC